MIDYKKVISSSRIRHKILDALSFVPDSIMLPVQYRIKLGRNLHLRNPRRFTEKIQWYKMHYRNPIMHDCVDKYKVREYVKSKGLENILVPFIAYYPSLEAIEWDKLPKQFVMKTTHGGGGLNVVICQDKNCINLLEIKEKLSFSSKPVPNNNLGREWAYYGLKPGIIIEKLLVNEDNPIAGINDYKIFCFNGNPSLIVVDTNRYTGHRRNFYDCRWNNLHIGSDCRNSYEDIDKPRGLDKMLDVASVLSNGFPFVRIDLYNQKEEVYFGEMTFYPWSGYVQFSPDEFDYELGNEFILPEK